MFLFITLDISVDVPPMSNPTKFFAFNPNNNLSSSSILEYPIRPPAGPDNKS